MARYRMTQNATVPDPELQPEQVLAIAALLTGATDEAAGQAAGVSRATVSRWKADATFRAALNAERKAAWAAHVDGLRALLVRAREVAAAAMDSDDEKLAATVALKILASDAAAWAGVSKAGPSTKQGVEQENLMDILGMG